MYTFKQSLKKKLISILLQNFILTSFMAENTNSIKMVATTRVIINF